jgi:hypothetical protein
MAEALNTPHRRVAAHVAQHYTSVAPPIASTRIYYNSVNRYKLNRYIEALT